VNRLTIVPKYHKLKRTACKASVAIEGLSGRGKSGLALAMGYVLAGENWDGVYVTDTENKSLNLYIDQPLHIGITPRADEINGGQLTAKEGYRPSHYAAWRQAAIEAGGKVWIADSLSHAWQYAGGILDMVNIEQQNNTSVNKWTVWGVPYIKAEKDSIMDLVRHPDIHTISTLRIKEKLELHTNDDGTKEMRSLGEQQIMMPDFKFEPDLVLSMLEPGYEDKPPVVKVIKSRYRILKFDETYRMTKDLLVQLRMYLEEGTNPEELLEMQRQDYLAATKEHLDSHPSSRAIWAVLKENAGHKNTKLADLPLKDLKFLFGQLTADN
jgi:hypothetical protein